MVSCRRTKKTIGKKTSKMFCQVYIAYFSTDGVRTIISKIRTFQSDCADLRRRPHLTSKRAQQAWAAINTYIPVATLFVPIPITGDHSKFLSPSMKCIRALFSHSYRRPFFPIFPKFGNNWRYIPGMYQHTEAFCHYSLNSPEEAKISSSLNIPIFFWEKKNRKIWE